MDVYKRNEGNQEKIQWNIASKAKGITKNFT
jgi:hypothetical protein